MPCSSLVKSSCRSVGVRDVAVQLKDSDGVGFCNSAVFQVDGVEVRDVRNVSQDFVHVRHVLGVVVRGVHQYKLLMKIAGRIAKRGNSGNAP